MSGGGRECVKECQSNVAKWAVGINAIQWFSVLSVFSLMSGALWTLFRVGQCSQCGVVWGSLECGLVWGVWGVGGRGLPAHSTLAHSDTLLCTTLRETCPQQPHTALHCTVLEENRPTLKKRDQNHSMAVPCCVS